ncbi:Hsp70 family chaperone [Penicillium verhagenii]|uniref:Hsp70 family chaperone n=1 Tax=Penicillium verhagenii TaxID=1562060 RepID=UPI0025453D72|nr:Hsp70 family chaperone [Penicillium verhagenii]KAJ5921154.1 Hsp70 family chaperone [Penicillium verhagenii]
MNGHHAHGNEGSRMKIVVAVDFGTTFSAVAYANTHNVMATLTTRLGPIRCLRYEHSGATGTFYWGFRAHQFIDRGEKIHEWFKLGLCNDFEERRARESELAKNYKSQTALPPVKGKECEGLVVDYLTGIKGAVDEYFTATYDEEVTRCHREYIITVPALWDHAEQEKTRRCAEKAGMGKGHKLQIISEPEAACIYAIQSMLTLNVNETFVICDAGGGTVDLASYTISSLNLQPFSCKLEGAAIGTGGLCGSSFLNRIFEEYLINKLKTYSGWNRSFMIDALKAFEERIKPNFTGESHVEHIIRIQGLVRSDRHGVYPNFLTLTTPELRENVFDKVINIVQAHVSNQIANTKKPVKAVLLAGGFGKNPYLKKRLQEIDSVMRHGIKVIQIENSDTAIARGALIAGLAGLGRIQDRPDDGGFNALPSRTEVISRIAGRSYGTAAYFDFDRAVDPESRRVPRDDGDKIEKIRWFAKMGDSIPDGKPMSFSFFKMTKVRSHIPADKACIPVVSIYSCEKKVAADYIDDPNVSKIVEFKLELHGLDIPITRKNGCNFYEAEFVIEMTLHAASLSFCGVYGKGSSAKRFPAKKVQFR